MKLFRRHQEPKPITDAETGEVYTADDLRAFGQDIARTWLHAGAFDENDAETIRKNLAKES